jgi:hypothetical protein
MRCKRLETFDPRKCAPFLHAGIKELARVSRGAGKGFHGPVKLKMAEIARSAEMRAFPSARERLLRSFGLMLKSSDGRRRQRPFIATMAPR